MPRRGLPETVSMRHDEHYVEALAASAGTPIGRLIPIDLIDPNPNQPQEKTPMSQGNMLQGKIVVVTGAGGGIGRDIFHRW